MQNAPDKQLVGDTSMFATLIPWFESTATPVLTVGNIKTDNDLIIREQRRIDTHRGNRLQHDHHHNVKYNGGLIKETAMSIPLG